MRFTSINADVEQMTLYSSSTTPIVANSPLNITSETMIPYSTNLMYEPVPFEFLYTAETEPQVFVTVDGLPAVCGSLYCNYTYIEPTGLISSFSVSGTTLTIIGSDLPTTNIESIHFSNSECEVSSATDT